MLDRERLRMNSLHFSLLVCLATWQGSQRTIARHGLRFAGLSLETQDGQYFFEWRLLLEKHPFDALSLLLDLPVGTEGGEVPTDISSYIVACEHPNKWFDSWTWFAAAHALEAPLLLLITVGWTAGLLATMKY